MLTQKSGSCFDVLTLISSGYHPIIRGSIALKAAVLALITRVEKELNAFDFTFTHVIYWSIVMSRFLFNWLDHLSGSGSNSCSLEDCLLSVSMTPTLMMVARTTIPYAKQFLVPMV